MIHTVSQLRQFLPKVVKQFQRKQCPQSAAALTYMTLFAIVPLMTVTYSMFSVIPAFQGLGEQLQGFIFSHFVPDTGQEVQKYLSDFSSQARELSAAGVGMLVVTAYFMLKNIERSFNNIWGLTEGRRGLSGFLLYWAVLSLGPLLLGVGLAMSTYLLSLQLMVSEYDSLGLMPAVLRFFPWVLSSAAFTLLFAAVPNCPVPLKDAFAGGVVTAVCFELFKDLFGFIVSQSSFSAIYGAFAFAPLFLLWVYILWMIVLAGAALVQSLSTYSEGGSDRAYPDLAAALLILWQFYRRQANGERVDGQLLSTLVVEPEQRQRLLDVLQQQRVLAVTEQGGLVLCWDLHQLRLLELAQMLDLQPRTLAVDECTGTPWFASLSERLASIDSEAKQQFDIPLSELFDGAGAAPVAVIDAGFNTDRSRGG